MMIKKIIKDALYKFDIRHQLSYLHIPKTGGTYIGQLESDSNTVLKGIHHMGHHYVVSSIKHKNPIYNNPPYDWDNLITPYSEIKHRKVIITVRNIYDWLVSYYYHAGGEPSKYLNKEHYDYKLAQKGFDYLVKSIVNREEVWPSRRFIFFQCFISEGSFLPDYVLRTHKLDEDLGKVAEMEGVRYKKRKKERVGRSGKSRDYRQFYNEELVDLVSKTWQREIELYGFDFENIENDNKIINLKVNRGLKRNISYSYKNDQLQK